MTALKLKGALAIARGVLSANPSSYARPMGAIMKRVVRGIVASIVLSVAPALSGAPITYDEAVSGDLPDGFSTPFSLDVGVNTFSGRVSFGDLDSISFSVPAATRLLGISYAFASSGEDLTGYALIAGTPPATTVLANAELPHLLGKTSTVQLFGSITPLNAGAYTLFNTELGGFKDGTIDYTFTLDVSTAPPILPTSPAKSIAGRYLDLFTKVADDLAFLQDGLDLASGGALVKVVGEHLLNDLVQYKFEHQSNVYTGAIDSFMLSAVQDVTKVAENAAKVAGGGALIELTIAAAAADVSVSALDTVLKYIVADPARFDDQYVLHLLDSIDLSALRALLGSGPLADSGFGAIQDLFSSIDAAVVTLAGAERSQGALAMNDLSAYANQADAYLEGVNALHEAANAFGLDLNAWEGQMRQAGVPDLDFSALTIDYSLLPPDEIALVRSELLDSGLFDSSSFDTALASVLNSPPQQGSGTLYGNLDSLVGPLSTLPPLTAASVDLPATLWLVALGLVVLGVARHRPLHSRSSIT